MTREKGIIQISVINKLMLMINVAVSVTNTFNLVIKQYLKNKKR